MNWRKIKAEYIAGGISQRAIAEKYGVSQATVERRAKKEKWTTERKAAEGRTIEKVSEKTAETIADNAVLLQNIKTKLLKRLEKMVDEYPEESLAEYKERKGNGRNYTEKIYRMRDIAAVYAALEDKTVRASVDIEDLSPLMELLRDE